MKIILDSDGNVIGHTNDPLYAGDYVERDDIAVDDLPSYKYDGTDLVKSETETSESDTADDVE